MSKYIDADALIEEIELCSYETWSKGVNRTWWAQAVKVKDNIKECIKRQPTADVVAVVRCKDCIARPQNYLEPFACARNNILVYGNSFCSYGIRREG